MIETVGGSEERESRPPSGSPQQRPPGLANVFWGAGIRMPTYSDEQQAYIRGGRWLLAFASAAALLIGSTLGLLSRSWYWGVGIGVVAYLVTSGAGAVLLSRSLRRSSDAAS
jgi:hypothetical protein